MMARPSTGGPLLAVRNVDKRFGGVQALDGCTLDIAARSITGLIGPNGAGKTTLFNVVSGLAAPDGGEIRLAGQPLHGRPSHVIARLGVARTFQIPRPLGRLTVVENLLVGAHGQGGETLWRALVARGAIARDEARLVGRADEILDFMGLAAVRDDLAETLSGGQKKLLELARALMSEPRVILLDEPGAGVNPTLLRSLVARIRELHAQGRTFVLIEHDMDLVTALCDPVIVLAGGRTLVEGPFEQVRRDPRVLEAYLGTAAA
jgi:branched-chain amino acid transport system ATP-binding protein